jgi:hypothetical protein
MRWVIAALAGDHQLLTRDVNVYAHIETTTVNLMPVRGLYYHSATRDPASVALELFLGLLSNASLDGIRLFHIFVTDLERNLHALLLAVIAST